jgi:chromosome segregation ATPase
MYPCEKCFKEFPTKYQLKRHTLNKLPCDTPKKIMSIQITKYNELENNIKDKEDQIKEVDDKLLLFNNNIYKIDNKFSSYELKSINKKNKCWYCKKEFSSKQSVKRHLTDSCIKKQKLSENKDKLIKDKQPIIEQKNKLVEEKNILIEEKNKLIEEQEKETKNNKIIMGCN